MKAAWIGVRSWPKLEDLGAGVIVASLAAGIRDTFPRRAMHDIDTDEAPRLLLRLWKRSQAYSVQ